MASTVTSAQAQRGGRGYRGGRGFRGYGGYRGGRGFRRWVCRHNYYSSGRRCFWVG